MKLDDLINRRKIAFYGFIEHLPEEDEKKVHKHLYIVPNGQINTDEITDYLLELDPNNPDKPLGCIPFHSSKFTDWYLYSVHDKDYLTSKGQSRKYSYKKEEVIVSDGDFFNEEIHRMDLSKLKKVKALREAVECGVPFERMLMNGQIPIQQVYAYKQTYDLISNFIDKTHRDGRQTHQKVDPETGEVIKTPTESPKKAPQSFLCKSDDVLRIEVIREASEACKRDNAPYPSYYEVHPQAEHIELDPDEDLPF